MTVLKRSEDWAISSETENIFVNTVITHHCIPLAKFADKQSPEAWHWTNLFPEWESFNCSKGARFSGRSETIITASSKQDDGIVQPAA